LLAEGVCVALGLVRHSAPTRFLPDRITGAWPGAALIAVPSKTFNHRVFHLGPHFSAANFLAADVLNLKKAVNERNNVQKRPRSKSDGVADGLLAISPRG